MTTLTAAIDIDEVCANLHEHWLALYRADYNCTLTPEDITHWEIQEIVKPECYNNIFKYLDKPDLYEGVKPVEGALEGVRALRERGYKVIFATSAPVKHGGRKFNWLHKHGFFDGVDEAAKQYVEIRDKSLLGTDVLVDDYYKNLEDFRGGRILFTRPHNRHIAVDGFYYTDNWPYLVRLIDVLCKP